MPINRLIQQIRDFPNSIEVVLPKLITFLAKGDDRSWEIFRQSLLNETLTTNIVDVLPNVSDQLPTSTKQEFWTVLIQQMKLHETHPGLIAIYRALMREQSIPKKKKKVEVMEDRGETEARRVPPPSPAQPSRVAPPSGTGAPPAPGAAPPPSPKPILTPSRSRSSSPRPTPAPTPASSPPTPQPPAPAPIEPASEAMDDQPRELEHFDLKKEEAQLFEETEEEEDIDESIASEISSQRYQKQIWMKHYSRMNINRVYPVEIELSDITRIIKKHRERLLTGEKQAEVTSELTLETDIAPIVTVEPMFPGCLVSPNTHRVNLEDPKSKILFHVLPLALGDFAKGKIRLIHERKVIMVIEAPFKVVNRRIIRTVSILATLIGFGPTAGEALTGISINNNLNMILWGLHSSIPDIDIAIVLEISAFLALLAGGVIFFQKNRDSVSEKTERVSELPTG